MKKVNKNILSSLLPQFFSILTNLVVPGLIIAKYGSEINGLISTTKTIISYISLVGAGIATAVTQSLYDPVAQNNIPEINGMLHAANNMFKKYGMLYLFLVVGVSIAYPCFINSTVKNVTIIMLLIVMSISGASEFFITGRCRALLFAKQSVYVCNVVQAISTLGSLMITVVMLHLNTNIVIVELTASFVYVFRAGILLFYTNNKYPEFKKFANYPPIEKAVCKRKDAMIHQLSGLAVSGSQPLILSAFVSLESASVYSVYNIVFNGLQAICANIGTSVTPFFGRGIAMKDDQNVSKIYNIMEFISFIVASFIFSVTIVMIVPFVCIYTEGADIQYNYPLFAILFCYSSLFYILKIPPTNIINAAGHFKQTRCRAITEALICVVLSVVCSAFWGQNGVLVGTLVALSWRCLDTFLYSNKYIIRCSNKRFCKRLLYTLVNVTIFAVISFKIWDYVFIYSFIEWIIMAICISLIEIVVLFIEIILLERTTILEMLSWCKKMK